MTAAACYAVRRPARSEFVSLRGLRVHLNRWDDGADGNRPLLVLLHGWMDVGASFQFFVDALADLEGPARHIVAPDWRGFGRTESPAVDSYWFPDYLGDLDALLDRLSPDAPVDLLGHSMGGNVAMTYAGARPSRIRRLINLEGFGLPATQPDEAPGRLAAWLDELRQPASLRDYASLEEVAERLRRNNPRLDAARAAWLAPHWAESTSAGRWRLRADPAHRRTNPVLARREEALAFWSRISAPTLWVEGDSTDTRAWWGDRYPRSDLESRLSIISDLQRAVLDDCGHMLHHDQPFNLGVRVARHLAS